MLSELVIIFVDCHVLFVVLTDDAVMCIYDCQNDTSLKLPTITFSKAVDEPSSATSDPKQNLLSDNAQVTIMLLHVCLCICMCVCV